MPRWRRYLHALQHDPPRVLFGKARTLLWRVARTNARRLRHALFGASVSQREFRRSLQPAYSETQALLRHLRAGQPGYFIAPGEIREVWSALNHADPSYAETVAAAAERACAHEFDLLGSGPVKLGPQIDWHADFKTGHRYNPQAYYTDIQPAPYPGGHDIKVPWELSRCQHLVWLGQAYALTADEKYAREFAAQVSHWIAANPVKFGVNWVCTMDVAIRAVNWLWAFQFFRGSAALSDDFLCAFARSLLEHGRHIKDNLEWSDTLTANHYLSDIVGLVYLGLLCPYFKEAGQWREFGLQELWREMEKQVYADGVDFEASISYHRLAAELFLSPVVVCVRGGVAVPAAVMARMEKMLEFVMHYTRPDGTAPLFGDSDNGRLHRLKVWADAGREWTDHRYLLAVGAVLFDREDFGRAAGDQWEEAFWMWGERALRFRERLGREAAPPRLPSAGFTAGGVYIMRGRSSYVAVDCGPNGQNGNGGHAHNDTLSFEYYALGRPWIVDAGTYVYTADYEQRHTFRSSLSHNAVVVNEAEANRLDKTQPFTMTNDARPTVHRWEVSEAQDVLSASHDGYERLSPPVRYRRTWRLEKAGGCLQVHDRLLSPGPFRYSVTFQFAAAEIELKTERLEAGGVAWLSVDRAGVAIGMAAAGGTMTLRRESGWVSESYGARRAAPALVVSGEAGGPLTLAWVFLPFENGRPSLLELTDWAAELLAAYD